jgi:16S rRNA (guanine966-N2)-methyltransferase
MRIIAGKFKGKNLSFLKSSTTRPLKDSVKENIFNVIAHSNLFNIDLKKSNVLDLYSGIGSFGLECISREVKKITFVEKNISAVKILRKNLTHLKINNNASVVVDDVLNFLKKDNSEKFEIIFLDPPFAENYYIKDLELIKKKQIYTKNHVIIIHREDKSSDDLNMILNPLVIKKYRRSKIIFAKFLN